MLSTNVSAGQSRTRAALMDTRDAAGAGCPWFHRYSAAAYAPSAVAALLAGADSFASPALGRLYARRAGYAFRNADALKPARIDERDARLLSALLAKLAQRGAPAPCSLSLERHVLAKAARAGIADFDERSDSGQHVPMPAAPRQPHRHAARVPVVELVLDRAERRCSRTTTISCAPGPAQFFDRLVARLGDERLALFAIPNRRVLSMLQFSRTRPASFDESVDFSVEIVTPEADRIVQLAVDLGDAGEAAADRARRLARAVALEEEGWTVLRTDEPGSREAQQALESMARAIAVPPAAFVRAADDLGASRRRPVCHRTSLLPGGSAATAFVADRFSVSARPTCRSQSPPPRPRPRGLAVATPSRHSAWCTLARPACRLAFTGETADVAYFGMPSIDAWNALDRHHLHRRAHGDGRRVSLLSGAGARRRPRAKRRADATLPAMPAQNVFRKVGSGPTKWTSSSAPRSSRLSPASTAAGRSAISSRRSPSQVSPSSSRRWPR
jgi:hypothetical protein